MEVTANRNTEHSIQLACILTCGAMHNHSLFIVLYFPFYSSKSCTVALGTGDSSVCNSDHNLGRSTNNNNDDKDI